MATEFVIQGRELKLIERLSAFCAKPDSGRYNLEYVHIVNKIAYATNAHMIAQAPVELPDCHVSKLVLERLGANLFTQTKTGAFLRMKVSDRSATFGFRVTTTMPTRAGDLSMESGDIQFPGELDTMVAAFKAGELPGFPLKVAADFWKCADAQFAVTCGDTNALFNPAYVKAVGKLFGKGTCFASVCGHKTPFGETNLGLYATDQSGIEALVLSMTR